MKKQITADTKYSVCVWQEGEQNMTTRERFYKLMNGEADIDQAPAIEWATWWDKTLRGWEAEGMPVGMQSEDIFNYFGLESHTQFWFQTVERDCPKQAMANAVPIIIKDEEDYQRLRPYFLPEDAVERRMKQIQATMPRYEKGETLVWYTLEGFFWFPRKLFGDEAQLYAFYDYPELYHQICEDLVEWQIRQVDKFAQYMKADFMTIAEDMSYNHGSLISKALFDEFMLPYYKRLIPEIKKYGTKVFVDSDGKVDDLIPWFMEAGVEGILPLERQAGVDLVEYRKKYPDFLFIGGFDKMALLRGKEAIRQEFERLLPVIESGRYMLGVDHQTPPGTTMENYRYYVQLLKEYSKRACEGI